ncbi:MAG: kelch-like protein [Chloroflexi bacterium]|nr:kelch-like protein [Chloroflexota bacterium]
MQVATGGQRVESHAWLRFKAETFGGESVSETAPGRLPPPGRPLAAPVWETRAPLPEPNSEFTVAQLGSKLYVLGGYPSTRITVPTVQAYDAREDRWELAAPLPLPLNHGMAASVDGKIYHIGGQMTAAGGEEAGFLDAVFEYNPATNAWASRAPMPTKRSSGAAVVVNGKIYVAGGRPPHGNEFAVYDPREDTWQTLPDLPTPRNHIAADAIHGKVYVVGGRFGGGFQSEVTDVLEVFDPATNTWTSRAPMPTKRGGVNGIAANGCLYVWGGEGQNEDHPLGVFAEHEVYNPVTDTWRSLSPMPVPVHGVTGAAFIDGWVHVPGGGTAYGGSSGSTINQVFRPELACR